MLKNYLKQSKILVENLLKLDAHNHLSKEKVNFVFGNESGDLDSIISSISYAFHQNIFQGKNKAFIPVMNFKKKDVNSKFELNYLFGKFNYDLDDLIYLNSFDLDQFVQINPETEFVLVDHNVPAETISRFKDRVVEIIDHHADKTEIYAKDQIKEKDIKKVGSCSTLVFNRIFKDIEIYKNIERDIFWFILGAILIDTYNFNPKEKDIRWNDLDSEAFKNIAGLLNDDKNNFFKTSSGEIESDKYFDVLVNLKFDEDMNLNLAFDELIIKDYKSNKYPRAKVGYSVFLFSVDKMLQKYSLKQILEEVSKFDKENNIDVHFLMFVWPVKNGFEREFGCYSPDSKILEGLNNYIINDLKLEFEDTKRIDESGQTFFLKDKTSTYSRKIFEPFVSKFFQ